MIYKNLIKKHKHVSTIFPAVFRRVETCPFLRERFNTLDGDFFDVDKLEGGHRNLVILLHGLEGSSKEHYIQGLARSFFHAHFDVYAKNFRSCSGEMNKTTKLYHSGSTEDLRLLVNEVLQNRDYATVSFVGFSLGANLLLKYLGEEGAQINRKINAAVSVSVPMDLRGCSYELTKGFNKIYSLFFMVLLRKKVKYIQRHHNHKALENVSLRKLQNFIDFDELVTAPLHGFESGEDYWKKSSSKQYLQKIKIPTKIINAKNDPFLSASCYPDFSEFNNDHLEFDYPENGGHVGFVRHRINDQTYVEDQALKFIQKNL